MTLHEFFGHMICIDDLVIQNNTNGRFHPRMRVTSLDMLSTPHNHRKIGIEEIVFDIDTHERVISDSVWQRISHNLEVDNLAHSVWDTSRSPHVHVFFRGLGGYPSDIRTKLKKMIIKHYAQDDLKWIDMSKHSDKNMIRQFNSKHEVTGKMNLCIYQFKDGLSLNQIPVPISNVFNLKNKALSSLPKSLSNRPNEALERDRNGAEELLEFARRTRFDKTGMRKNNTYFKNIAIAGWILGLNEVQFQSLALEITLMNRGHTSEQISNWYKWCKTQASPLEINWNEIYLFYKRGESNVKSKWVGLIKDNPKRPNEILIDYRSVQQKLQHNSLGGYINE